MGCDCGKPKCDGHCGVSPAVLQINNPSECVLFHRVEVPASMGDSKTNPPKSGAYKNVLLYYEADQTSWLYSSDGIPQKLVNGLTNYEAAINLPQINGVTLLGNKSLDDLGIADAVDDAVAGEKAEREAADEAIQDELLSRAVVFDTVAEMKTATNLVNGSYARTLGFHSINDGGGALYKITSTGTANEMDVIAVDTLYAHLIYDHITPIALGAYGDGSTVDNASLNRYFEICATNNLDANGLNKTYLVDNSTASYSNHTGLKVPNGMYIHNFGFKLKSGSTHFNTILACKYGTRPYVIENCSFEGELRNPSGAGGEDGGNHGIIFTDDIDMFPTDWLNYPEITIRNCTFNNIQSYGIFPAPNNNKLSVIDCNFSCHGPAILTYATTTLVKGCSYTYLDSQGTTIHDLCHDEIENFTAPTDIKKNITIEDCTSSHILYEIGYAVQTGVNYGDIVINRCSCDRELIITLSSNFGLTADNIIIKDSTKNTTSGDSGYYIHQVTANVTIDNVKSAKNSRIITTGSITLLNLNTDRQILLGASVIDEFIIRNCKFYGTQTEGFLSGIGSTAYPSMNKMIFENCDFNTRSIILRNVNPAKLIMQNVRSIGYTGRYLYNPTQQSGTAYIDGLVMDTANTGSDFLIDGMATVYVNSIDGAVLLHNYTSRVINTLVIS